MEGFMLSTTRLVSGTARLYSTEMPAYILMVGFVQFALGLLADLVFFSSSPVVRPLYTAAMGTDPFSVLTAALNLIGFSSNLIVPSLIYHLAGAAIMAVFTGGALHLGIHAYRQSSTGDIKVSLSHACKRAGTLIAIQLLTGSLILLVASPFIFALVRGVILLYPISPYAYLDALGHHLPLFLICLSGVAYVSSRFALAPVAAIAEDLSTMDAMRRSWRLYSGNSAHAFKGVLLLMTILGLLTGSLSLLALVTFFGFSTLMTLVPAAIIQILLSPIFCSFQVILYSDLLARRQSQTQRWWSESTQNRKENKLRFSAIRQGSV
jgi:hypothetical protein